MGYLRQGDKPLNFYTAYDNTVVGVYISSPNIPDEQKSKIPMQDILKQNNTVSRFFYGMGVGEHGVFLSLSSNYDAAAINKVTLRKAIDGILEAFDEGEPLWNPEKWTTAPAASAEPPAPATPAGK